jgi:hypothetical protein
MYRSVHRSIDRRPRAIARSISTPPRPTPSPSPSPTPSLADPDPPRPPSLDRRDE